MMATAQELLEQAKQNAQMAAYRKAQKDQQKRQIPGQVWSLSKGLDKSGGKLADLGSTLSKSTNSTVANIGDKMQTFGGHMQTASGQPLYNDLKSKAGQMIADKLGLGASNTAPTALTEGISQAAPSATSSLPSTIGAAEGAGALGTAAGGTAGTTAGTGSAIGSAIGANVAGTAGTTAGTSALGSAIGTAAPAATSAAGAGAGAATAGAGAAAGGAGAGAAALGALGPIGAGLAVAALIYNMFQSAQKKKQQAAMQKDMENVQKTQQEDAQKKSEVMNELDQNINGNIQGLAQDTQPVDAKQSLINSLMSNFRGEPTGAAAPVNFQNATPEDTNIQFDPLAPVQSQDPKQSLKDKLVGGFKDMYAGYKDNSTNGLMQGDLVNQLVAQPQQPTNEVLTNYQDQLLNAGYDQNVVDAVAEGKNSGYKEIDQWIKDNPEAFNGQGVITGGASKAQPKSVWNRVGEAVGTGQRLLSNPIVQGLIAGTLYAKDKGDALYGVGKGVEWAQNKAKSNYYSDTLGQPRQVLGNYDVNDYNANINAAYKGKMVDNAEQRIANTKDYQDQMVAQRKADAEERKRHNQAIEANQQARINAIKNRGGSTYDPTLEPDFYDDYANYAEGEDIFSDDERYAQEVDDMLAAMNQGKGWFDKKATRAEAEAEVNRLHRQEQMDFYKKYKINPMKGKIK